MLSIHQISSWRKGERRIRHRFYFKSVLHFGSDKSCDWRWGFDTPLVGRLDTQSQILTFLHQDREIPIESGNLFELEGQIFSWTQRRWFSFRWLISFAVLAAISLGVLLFQFQFRQESCSEEMSRIFKSWSPESKILREKRKVLERALRSKDTSVVQTELFLYEEVLRKFSGLKACSTSSLVAPYRSRLNEIIFYEEARKNNFENALSAWAELTGAPDYLMSLNFKRDILRLGRDLAWRAWRLESKDPIQAREAQSFLDEVCMSLKKDPDCFLPQLDFLGRRKTSPKAAKSAEEGSETSLGQRPEND